MVASLKESAIQYAKANIRVFPFVPNSNSEIYLLCKLNLTFLRQCNK